MAECIFLAIIVQQIPATVVTENAQALAIMHTNSANEGHVLVLPKVHSTDLFERSLDVGSDVMPLCL